jgi:hypothetical protein
MALADHRKSYWTAFRAPSSPGAVQSMLTDPVPPAAVSVETVDGAVASTSDLVEAVERIPLLWPYSSIARIAK